jgi:hypothetical protein
MKKRIIINKFIYFPQKITLFYIILKISTLYEENNQNK